MKKKKSNKKQGMGAICTDNGTTFRVWAPHADQVSVIGDFNDWKEKEDEMDQEDDGYWSIHLEKAKKGQEYKFFIQNGKQKLQKNDPYAQKMSNSNGNSVIDRLDYHWQVEDFKMAAREKLVIYELHIGTFFRTGSSDVGDFSDAEIQLKYLQDLGVTAIEVMPISEFPGANSWGYNPAYPMAVETDYGSPEDLAKFVDKAHSHGIAVIIDVVFNHFGPSDMDLWQFDGWSENDKGGIYFYNDYRSSTPWGDTRPDYGRQEVRRYIRDYVFLWLEKYRCDGIRIDAVSYIRHTEGANQGDQLDDGLVLLRQIIGEIKTKYPHKIVIAEDMQGDTFITEPLEEGGLGFDAQWDTKFVHPVRRVLEGKKDEHRSMRAIVDALSFRYGHDAFKRVIYCESHDSVANGKARLPEDIEPGEADSEFAKKRACLGGVLALTAPGIPMMFQGEEFLTDDFFTDDQALDWDHLCEFQGVHRLFKDLIGYRTSEDCHVAGLQGQKISFLHFNQDDQVVAYERIHDDHPEQKLVVVVNFSYTSYDRYTIGLPAEGRWELIFNSSSSDYGDSYENSKVNGFETENQSYEDLPVSGRFSLPGYAALIFTHEKK